MSYIGNIEIKKAYLGATELTSRNAFMGLYPLIKGTEPPVVILPNFGIKAKLPGTVSFSRTDRNLQYTTDGTNWIDYTGQTISLSTGDVVYWQRTVDSVVTGSTSGGFGQFTITGESELQGNINSLLVTHPESFTSLSSWKYVFYKMFENQSSIKDISRLQLPATTLGNYCYAYMFSGCSGFTTAPALPATTLGNYCYQRMFNNCSSLNNVRLYADHVVQSSILTLKYYYTDNWLAGVAPTGVLYNYGNATDIPTGNTSGCPTGWSIRKKGFQFVANASSTVSFSRPDRNLAYSVNGGTATNYTGQTISLSTGDVLEWNRQSDSIISGETIGQFTLTGNLDVEGDITTLLTSAPTLTDLSSWTICCYRLFYNQTAIRNASGLTLPATRVGNYCYQGMFYQCNNLTSTPKLPATTLANGCYNSMFYGCTSLTTAPALPATTLVNECYGAMFHNCSGLTTAPALPATALAVRCYANMFQSCTSLTTTPALPGKTLFNSCYNSMFQGCTSLTTAPVLSATTLAANCYISMFSGCTSLNSVTTYAEDISATNCLYNWLSNVSPTGTFTNYGGATYPTGASGIPTGWIEKIDYFKIKANAASTVKFSNTDRNLTYSLNDGVTWTNYTGQTISLSTGAEVAWLRTTGTTIADEEIGRFTLTGDVEVYGDISTLIYNRPNKTNISGWNRCCQNLFNSQTAITKINNLTLPATTLAEHCYGNMFVDCSGITTIAPALPAKTLAANCYQGMFARSGTKGIYLLPATTLADHCYHDMFNGCTSLTTRPALPATTMQPYCYYQMYKGCTAITSTPTLSSTTLADYCYYGMFSGCTGLTSVTTLPATTLKTYCYASMFQGCTSLTKAPALPATTLQDYCYYKMFSACTGLTASPDLKATTLVANCYAFMFNNCSKLNKITIYANSKQSTSTTNWVTGVASSGDFYNYGSLTWATGVSGRPSGWTLHTS